MGSFHFCAEWSLRMGSSASDPAIRRATATDRASDASDADDGERGAR